VAVRRVARAGQPQPVRASPPFALWDTWGARLHLWGMVAELSSPGAIPASTVAAAVAGDAMAFARIVRAYHDDMARVCHVMCGDAELAQDAAQSAWPIAWRKLGSLRDPEKLRPWLVSIAVNEARQLVRRLRRDRIVAIELADLGSDDGDPARRSADDVLVSAIRRLPIEDRTLIALRYVAGFDATEIGRALGLSPSGVRSRLARLVARLREEIDDE
jgi:RNA polymerase sigma factor (sigma-70 family)